MSDLLSSSHITGAIYFTDQGQYLFKYKKSENEIVSKSLRAPEVSAAFTCDSVDSGWIKPGIMRCGSNHLGDWFLYFVPKCKVAIQIGTSKKITIPVPATVLIACKKAYYLFALVAKDFSSKAAVYHAPFPNVYSDGKICWGRNTAPKVNMESAFTAWELFFASPFNGDLASGKSRANNADIRVILKKLAGKDEYPVDDLVSCDGSVDRLFKRMVEVHE